MMDYTIGRSDVGVAVANDQPRREENGKDMRERGRCTFCVRPLVKVKQRSYVGDPLFVIGQFEKVIINCSMEYWMQVKARWREDAEEGRRKG